MKENSQQSKIILVFKCLLSVFVIYHLVTVTVLANGYSVLSRSLGSYLIPYANNLGINASWNFFAPDPAHTMYFHYRIHFGDEIEDTDKPVVEGYFPPEKSEIVTDASSRRLLYAMRYLILDPQKLETIFIPWLCRRYPGATSVFVEHIIERIPNLDLARVRASDSVASLRQEIQTTKSTLNCPKDGASDQGSTTVSGGRNDENR